MISLAVFGAFAIEGGLS